MRVRKKQVDGQTKRFKKNGWRVYPAHADLPHVRGSAPVFWADGREKRGSTEGETPYERNHVKDDEGREHRVVKQQYNLIRSEQNEMMSLRAQMEIAMKPCALWHTHDFPDDAEHNRLHNAGWHTCGPRRRFQALWRRLWAFPARCGRAFHSRGALRAVPTARDGRRTARAGAPRARASPAARVGWHGRAAMRRFAP